MNKEMLMKIDLEIAKPSHLSEIMMVKFDFEMRNELIPNK